MITFAVPSWNRQDRLEVCLNSIAHQIEETGLPAKIVVSDNCSDDNTSWIVGAVQDKFPAVNIQSIRLLNHVDYAENFKAVVEMVETPWTWLMGDDDELLPGALVVIYDRITRAADRWPGTELFYASQDFRCTDMTGSDTESTLLDLCCRFGLMDTLGFMSCLVFRTDRFKAGLSDLTGWECYKENSFLHTCILLEQLGNEPATIIDVPMVKTQDEAGGDTPERWLAENISGRYFLISDALKFMMSRGTLPPKLPARFFRYHQFYLWDRFCTELMSMYRQNKAMPPDLHFDLTGMMADMVNDAELAKFIATSVHQVKFSIATMVNASNAFDHLQQSFHHATIPSMKLMVP